MTRVVSVGRSKSLLVTGALGLALLVVSLTGCPGTLSNPNEFPSGTGGSVGAAGSGPGTAGTGAAGTGAAGTGAGNCNMVNLITVKYTCTLAGACHDGTVATAGGMSMLQADWPKLVGGLPSATAGAKNSVCANDANYKTMPYITKGSSTGDGLLLKKLMSAICAPGGNKMPTLNGPVNATDMACFQQWATQLASM